MMDIKGGPKKVSHYQMIKKSFSFPGSCFPGARDSRPFSFPDSRELKRRHSWKKRERVKGNWSLNETPGSDYSAFKWLLLAS